MTLESSTMMNWADTRISLASHLRTRDLPIARLYSYGSHRDQLGELTVPSDGAAPWPVAVLDTFPGKADTPAVLSPGWREDR